MEGKIPSEETIPSGTAARLIQAAKVYEIPYSISC